MDAVDFAGFWLRHQRIGTRSTSNLFPARALAFGEISKGGANDREADSHHTTDAAARAAAAAWPIASKRRRKEK
jgi:hypothetical protein